MSCNVAVFVNSVVPFTNKFPPNEASLVAFNTPFIDKSLLIITS